MSDEPKSDAVGYGRPPRQHRFQPGKSGNPKGRPKGSRNFKTIVQAVMNEKITVMTGGRRRTITKAQAVIEKLVQRGIGDGHMAALDRLLQYAEQSDRETVTTDAVVEPDDAEIIAQYVARMHAGTTDAE